jgi:pyridoxamine 5'-phosphate oxidase
VSEPTRADFRAVIDPARLRAEYETRGLDAADVDPDPVVQFRRWFDEAAASAIVEPHAMTLSTVDAAGRPQARVVLLRGLDERGFAFYTNRESAKGHELADAPHAALTFAWLPLHRQVRVTGPVTELPDAASDAYFALRPRGAQIGAWASAQSAVLPDRAALDEAVARVREGFGDGDIPRPPHWGGYAVKPEVVELWQGRPNRLHDRLRYRRDGGRWVVERLAP